MSDLGMRRINNQDSLAVVITDDATKWSRRGHLMMVADGMGAHAAGELASKLAVDNIPHTYFKLRDLYPPAAIRQAIREANALVHAKGQSEIGFQGMGTTCSCLVLLPQGALVAHIGDSRVYRLRGDQLAQLTFDHSLVWEMAAAGHMAEEDVPAYIPKNVITRSLGPHEAVNIDIEGPYDAAENDVFLLCSDGLTGQLTDAEIGAVLQCFAPADAAQTLVDLANLRGGPDNISVVVARVEGGEIPMSDTSCGETPSAAKPARSGTMLRVASFVCLLALAYCLISDRWVEAAISAAGLATAIGMLIAGRNGRRAVFNTGPIGGPYGNGPYRQVQCPPNRELVDRLQEAVAKLQKLHEDSVLSIDIAPLRELSAKATTAAEAGEYHTAVQRFGDAIRATMRQIGKQDPSTDSGIGNLLE